MVNYNVGVVPLEPLRTAVAPIFADYDKAVRLNDRLRALRAKRAIVAEGKRTLAPSRVDGAGGIYFFLSELPATADNLKYIGRSRPSRPLASRIVDRFRDDTALDRGCYGLPIERVQEIAYGRMRTAMRSSDETLRTFAEKHCETMYEFRDLTHVVVIPILDQQLVIDHVEHILIYTASQIGCGLTNVQERRRLRSGAAEEAGRVLAILDHLRNVLDPSLLERWSAEIRRLNPVCSQVRSLGEKLSR